MQIKLRFLSSAIIYAVTALALIACSNAVENCENSIILKTTIKGSFLPGVYLVSSDGNGETKCKFPKKLGDTPAWSPDGKWIVYSAQDDNSTKSQIFVLIDGKKKVQLTNEIGGATKPVWSHEGSRVAYETADGISLLDLSCLHNQKECQFVPFLLTSGIEPSWSPIEDLIVYVNNNSLGVSEVQVIDVKHPDFIVNVTPPDVEFCGDPRWSPDGKIIAVSCYGNNNHDIHLIIWENLQVTNITNSPNYIDTKPVWSPDGRRIAFISNRDDDLGKCLVDECTVISRALFIMNADGTNPIRISFRSDEHIIWYSWIP
jgi:Tol biopolymer transport system component